MKIDFWMSFSGSGEEVVQKWIKFGCAFARVMRTLNFLINFFWKRVKGLIKRIEGEGKENEIHNVCKDRIG